MAVIFFYTYSVSYSAIRGGGYDVCVEYRTKTEIKPTKNRTKESLILVFIFSYPQKIVDMFGIRSVH